MIARLACLLMLLVAAPLQASPDKSGPAADRAINLSGVVDWSVQQPFLDVMKTARLWIGHRPGQWGGVEYPELVARGLLDADGWPLRIPPDLASIGTIVLTDLPEAATGLSGRYVLSFDGSGIVEVSGRANGVRYGERQVSFDFAPGLGGVVVKIQRSDPADPVRAIRIVREDRVQDFAAGAIFNPDWTARIGVFGAVRFMDWMRTNNATVSAWDDRPKPGDATFDRAGVPLEVMVALANEQGFNPWFTLPHLATDDYVRRFATYVRDHLDPALTAYVEYSNEVWNGQFTQSHWAEEQAMARWGREWTGGQFYGMRTAQMADIWKDVFGAAAADRLVTVIATQTGWLGREADILAAPLWVAEDPSNRPPADHVDAYAVTGYFSALLGHEEKLPLVRDWLARSSGAAEAAADAADLSGEKRAAYVAAHRYDVAVTLAARELRDGSVSGDARDSLADLTGRVLPYHRGVAQENGLDLVMYEGGSHVTAIGPAVDDPEVTDFFAHLNYTPEMGALYMDLIRGWGAAGGTLFNAYADVVWPGKWGSWGALRFLGDDNPRWRALTETAGG